MMILNRKRVNFQWIPGAQLSLDQPGDGMSNVVVVAVPTEELQFFLDTDAMNIDLLGGGLLKQNEWKGKVITTLSTSAMLLSSIQMNQTHPCWRCMPP